MLRILTLGGPVLVDDYGLPRFWSAVWTIFHGGNLSPSTVRQKLRHIESLYKHTEALGCDLDDALSSLNFDTLTSVLDSFFAVLRNVPVPVNSNITRWKTAFHFVKDICERLERNPSVGNHMAVVREHMARLDNLYLGLRPHKKKHSPEVRALPKSVLIELLDAVSPGSPTNPFEYESTQWRIYAGVMLMFFQGLRIGEMSALPANFIKSEVDARTGTRRWFMSVTTDETGDDPRHSKPSLKTESSIRTIPMTAQTATIMQTYAENYRGRPNFRQFLVSMHKKPMSIEGMRHAMRQLTESLSPEARKQLFDQTGARNLVPHALRHTCAVVRMKQWTRQGLSPAEAMMRMRSFFGWSRESLMPMLYAKAALDEQLNDSWNEQLDDRVNFLKDLPNDF